MQHAELSKSKRFRLCVEASNRGQMSGRHYWQIDIYDREVGWYLFEDDRRPVEYVDALRSGRERLQQLDQYTRCRSCGTLLAPGSICC